MEDIIIKKPTQVTEKKPSENYIAEKLTQGDYTQTIKINVPEGKTYKLRIHVTLIDITE